MRKKLQEVTWARTKMPGKCRETGGKNRELGPILFGGVENIIDFLRQKQLPASTMDCSRYAKFYKWNLYYIGLIKNYIIINEIYT